MQEFQGRRTILENYAELDILRGMKYRLLLISVEGKQIVKISCQGMSDSRLEGNLGVIQRLCEYCFFFFLVGWVIRIILKNPNPNNPVH